MQDSLPSIALSRRPIRRHARRWSHWVTGALVLAFVGLGVVYIVNLYRVVYGDQRDISLTAAWPMVSTDSLAAVAIVDAGAGGNAHAAPILVRLVASWQAEENRLEPGLIAAAWPTRAGDVVVVLNPAFYSLDSPYGYATPADQHARIERLATTWQVILATSGRPWPQLTGDPPPGLIVIRRDHAPAHGDTPVVSVVADTRDSVSVLYGRLAP